ncbi:uncharacterized protein [Apostichopus japonicus]|uniref:uncharacterized protein isoform X2 n=1 Tax=Stichopus japonicus TaxID=307972 RepID=UPI003AB1DFF8
MDYKKIEAGECTEENGNSSDEREEMDYKKTEAGECTEENGNSSEEREESSIRSNSLTSSVSGDKNIVLSNCNVNFNIQEIKQPKRRAPLRKEDEVTPRKKKRVGSDKPSDKGRKMSEETLPGTSGSAGKSGRGKKSSGKTKTSDTDKENKPKVPCSKLSTLFKNVKKSYPLIRVKTYDVEVQSSQRRDTKKWIPGRFRVMDSSGWAYLIVIGKAKGKIFKKGESIEITDVTAKNKDTIMCNADSVKSSSEPVQMSDCIVDKMKQGEKFTPLKEIRKGKLIEKTKVFIEEVGELQKRHNSGEPYDFRELKVKATRRAKGVETLEAYDLPAKFKYKVGQEVKVASVKYHKIKKKFQTWGDCLVEKLSDL